MFRFDPATGAVESVVDDFNQPSGLAFSPDATRLYIADSGASHDGNLPRHIRVFDVVGDRLANGRVFVVIDKGIPTVPGLAADWCPNQWRTCALADRAATGCSSPPPRRCAPCA